MASWMRGTLYGCLGKDPELKQVGDDPMASFSIAVNRKTKNGDEVDWWDVTVWGKQAENCAQYLSKGSYAICEGDIIKRKYTSQEGHPRTAVDMRAYRVTFLSGKKDNADEETPF